MTLIPEIHDALARAVAAPAVRRRWWDPSRRAGLLAIGAVVVSGSAFAATGAWHPTLGDDHRGHPQPARAGVPPDQLAALAVLRRGQTERDRGPDVAGILRLLPRGEINGVHTDGIRVLRRRSSGATILVPAERVGRHDPGYASSVQRQVLCVLTGITIPPRAATVIGHDGKPSTIHTPGGLSAGQNCGDLNQLNTIGIGGSGRTSDGWITGALVPDGVAHVVIRLRHYHHLTAPVHDNFYEINTGNELAPGWGVQWLDAQGRTVDHRRTRSP